MGNAQDPMDKESSIDGGKAAPKKSVERLHIAEYNYGFRELQ
jgi:hypothetical protein